MVNFLLTTQRYRDMVAESTKQRIGRVRCQGGSPPHGHIHDRSGPHGRPLLGQAHDGHHGPRQVHRRLGHASTSTRPIPPHRRRDINVQAASVDTGFGARDTHLRSDDFFGAETYPEITVVSTAIRPKSGNHYVVTADVTIRDTTKSVDFDVEFLGFFPGMDGARHAGFTATAKVNRKDWGLDWNVALEAGGWLVGDTDQARGRRRRPGGRIALAA